MRLKREDDFSPASSSHFLRLFPTLYLAKLSETDYVSKSNNYEYLFGELRHQGWVSSSCSERTFEN